MKLKGYHNCCEQWAIEKGTCKRIRLNKVVPFIENTNPILINHELISWKGKDNPEVKIDFQYKNCDISFPGIVCSITNPHNLPYRLLDGSHRMTKMVLETNVKESYFYVLEPEIFYSLLEDVPADVRAIFN